jgi:polyhydroxybutyrate depolymerase
MPMKWQSLRAEFSRKQEGMFGCHGGLVVGMVMLWCTAVLSAPMPNTTSHVLESSGIEREYLVHVPPTLPLDRPLPLVFVFHGGNSNATQMEILTGFSQVADVKNFLVVYPEGIEKNWNDGRKEPILPAQRYNINDVKFVEDLITTLSKKYPIDPQRIYATGISNGGMFTHYLAMNLSTKIAAGAIVGGGLAERAVEKFQPEQPVSMLIIQGTADPVVPYHGGGVDEGRRGRIIGTERATKMWVEHNGCTSPPESGEIPDLAPFDGCRVKWQNWPAGRNGTDVTLYTIEGGGHTWPGSLQFLPKIIIGPVCRDFHATAIIWDFFEKHPKR